MRKIQFANHEYYHIYNRGVDKRDIFMDKKDVERFWESMHKFNTREPIGSIHEQRSLEGRIPIGSLASNGNNLVIFIAYCLNPNHYHFILRQEEKGGIEHFMHRLGTGYSKYFNARQERTGSLFQGPFKAVHIDSNEKLLRLLVYVNYNDSVHDLSIDERGIPRSSALEYEKAEQKEGLCDLSLRNEFKSENDYNRFVHETLNAIKQERMLIKETRLESI